MQNYLTICRLIDSGYFPIAPLNHENANITKN